MIFKIIDQPICSEKCDITACPNHQEYTSDIHREDKTKYPLKGISPYCVYTENGNINYDSPAVSCNYIDTLDDDEYVDSEYSTCYVYGGCTWCNRQKEAGEARDKALKIFHYNDKIANAVWSCVYSDKKYFECDLHNLKRSDCQFNKRRYERVEAAIDKAFEMSEPDYDPYNDPDFDYVDEEGCGHTFEEDYDDNEELEEAFEENQMRTNYSHYRGICKFEAQKSKSVHEHDEVDENEFPF